MDKQAESKDFVRVSIRDKYLEYLKTVKLSEDEMSSVQRIETERTFFAAFGIAIISMRDESAKQSESNAIRTMKDCLSQVLNFFNKERMN